MLEYQKYRRDESLDQYQPVGEPIFLIPEICHFTSLNPNVPGFEAAFENNRRELTSRLQRSPQQEMELNERFMKELNVDELSKKGITVVRRVRSARHLCHHHANGNTASRASCGPAWHLVVPPLVGVGLADS